MAASNNIQNTYNYDDNNNSDRNDKNNSEIILG